MKVSVFLLIPFLKEGTMKNNKVLKISLTGMLLAISFILPKLLGGVSFGNMLCPKHIPVIICGMICGPQYGLICGALSALYGPPLYPIGISMCVELGVYGFLSGYLYNLLSKKDMNKLLVIYISLISSQIVGRLFWGLTRFIIGIIDTTNVFTFKMFLSGAFIIAYPAIILQLIIIPALLKILIKANYLK